MYTRDEAEVPESNWLLQAFNNEDVHLFRRMLLSDELPNNENVSVFDSIRINNPIDINSINQSNLLSEMLSAYEHAFAEYLKGNQSKAFVTPIDKYRCIKEHTYGKMCVSLLEYPGFVANFADFEKHLHSAIRTSDVYVLRAFLIHQKVNEHSLINARDNKDIYPTEEALLNKIIDCRIKLVTLNKALKSNDITYAKSLIEEANSLDNRLVNMYLHQIITVPARRPQSLRLAALLEHCLQKNLFDECEWSPLYVPKSDIENLIEEIKVNEKRQETLKEIKNEIRKLANTLDQEIIKLRTSCFSYLFQYQITTKQVKLNSLNSMLNAPTLAALQEEAIRAKSDTRVMRSVLTSRTKDLIDDLVERPAAVLLRRLQ